MTQTRFEQLSKEMAVFSQQNHRDYDKLQKFFLYELNLRCVSKDFLAELSEQKDDDVKF